MQRKFIEVRHDFEAVRSEFTGMMFVGRQVAPPYAEGQCQCLMVEPGHSEVKGRSDVALVADRRFVTVMQRINTL